MIQDENGQRNDVDRDRFTVRRSVSALLPISREVFIGSVVPCSVLMASLLDVHCACIAASVVVR